MTTRNQHFDRHDVRRILNRKGETLTSIAEKHGYCESICRMAFYQSTPIGEAIIAMETGIPAQQIWPDRYDRNGNRRVFKGKTSKAKAARKRKTKRNLITNQSSSSYKRKGAAHG